MNLIDFVTVDSYGNRWFATRTGLIKFDGKTWETTSYSINNDNILFVHCFMIDPSMNIWIADHEGLIKYDGKTWRNLSKEIPLLSSQKIHWISMNKDGVVWVLAFRGLFSFSNNSWLFHRVNFEESKYKYEHNPIGIDEYGNIWIASRKSLIQFTKRKRKEVSLSEANIVEKAVLQVHIDQRHNVWLSTSDVILRFNGKKWKKWKKFEIEPELNVPVIYPRKNLFSLATSYGMVLIDKKNTCF